MVGEHVATPVFHVIIELLDDLTTLDGSDQEYEPLPVEESAQDAVGGMDVRALGTYNYFMNSFYSAPAGFLICLHLSFVFAEFLT